MIALIQDNYTGNDERKYNHQFFHRELRQLKRSKNNDSKNGL
ncbi:hypothetical protein B4134_3823 [Bacillus safensis]|nr:hypothetical protein B4107_3781 [Bacillus safensis]KIL20327.1 hypothetical protein B4134_3823 [Bacillus safensis]